MICPAQGFLCREVSPRESGGFLGFRIVSLPRPDSSEETETVAKSSVAHLSGKAEDSSPYPCPVPLNTREGNLFFPTPEAIMQGSERTGLPSTW